ncbi:MAG: glucose 1-dehydrogenase [Cytophagales bacterium]|nr:glucose 1-dehydrogenase [Armatimonadota bacterium]
MQLNGKVALITGASSGIGRAIALRFAREGAKVVVNFLGGSPDREAQAKQVVGEAGGETVAVAIAADVSKRAEVEAMFQQAVAKFGRLDIAVNNAGIELKKDFLEVTDSEWDLVIAVNLKGPFLVTQAACRQFVAQGDVPGVESKGKIVNISSTHEDIPFPNYTSYCASKGGLRMFTRNLGVDLAPLKININNIAPGAIATPINQAVLDDPRTREETTSEIPWGRWGTPEDVANLAVFLSSGQSDYVTGATYYVDGALALQVTKY